MLAQRVGARVRQLRAEKAFTFDAFVEEVGLGRGYVSELERGLVVPSLRALATVAEALEVTVADLVLSETPREQLFALSRHLRQPDLDALLATARRASPEELLPLPRVPRSRHAIPVYGFRPAAGAWSRWQRVEISAWVQPPDFIRARKGLCVARVSGRSMEPDVPDGSWCLFAAPWDSPRSGEVGIFMKAEEPAGGALFTLKAFAPARGALEPRNRAFSPIRADPAGTERAFARLLRVLR
ncbi:MAG: helix-turn-helix domain-containing protein [Myxococcaceae bacterium]|nr:helix-turn-helix domain-containing protein [Myxococcaceae bacterium]